MYLCVILLHVFDYLQVIILQFVGDILGLLVFWHGGWGAWGAYYNELW